jgi:uncharacterized protein with FMN-binding domain
VVTVSQSRSRPSGGATPASLGRRILPAVLIAGASGALLTQLDHPVALASGGQAGAATTSGAKAGVGKAGTVARSGSTAGSASSTASPTSPATTAPAPGTLPPTIPARVPVRPQPGAGQAPGAAVAPTTALAPACTGTPVDGPAVGTRFGPVQVAATISSDGKLCDVKALVTPSSHRRSVQINNFAVPVLHDRAIAAQGSDFNAVSGATLTSDAYATSLQSILDHR